MPAKSVEGAPPTARMFVALVPPEDVTAYLADRIAGVAGMMDGLRWTARRNWHVTLAFLAAVPLDRVERAIAELSDAVPVSEPFVLRLGGAGGFPRPARAGVLWIGADGATADDARALTRLAKHVRIGLRRAHLRPDRTPFRPHVTLARVRPAADVTQIVQHLARTTEVDQSPVWPVRELLLMESRLGAMPDGSAAHLPRATLTLG